MSEAEFDQFEVKAFSVKLPGAILKAIDLVRQADEELAKYANAGSKNSIWDYSGPVALLQSALAAMIKDPKHQDESFIPAELQKYIYGLEGDDTSL